MDEATNVGPAPMPGDTPSPPPATTPVQAGLSDPKHAAVPPFTLTYDPNHPEGRHLVAEVKHGDDTHGMSMTIAEGGHVLSNMVHYTEMMFDWMRDKVLGLFEGTPVPPEPGVAVTTTFVPAPHPVPGDKPDEPTAAA